MHRIAIVLLAMGLFVVAVPTTAEAHEGWCMLGDMDCWAKCQASHVTNVKGVLDPHACRWAVGPPP